MSFFQNKTVWITGASSGLGEALAKAFATEKAKLILSARREQELQRVKADCTKFIPAENILILPMDVTCLSTIDAETKKVIDAFGRIDILANNAGVTQRSYVHNTPIDIERKIMEVNYFSAVVISKAVLPYMQKQKDGHIIVLSSLMGKFGYYRRSSYCAAKHALNGYFEALRMEEKHNNIRVTIVCPGFIRTNATINALTETGNTFNKMDEGQKNGMAPEKAAKKIISAVRNNRMEIFMGGHELMSLPVRKFFPGFFYKNIMKFGPK